MLYDDSTVGQTYELYGPREYRLAEIAAMVDKEIYKKRRHVNVPKSILKPVAGLINKLLYWQTLSADVVEREFLDQRIDPEAKTFKDLGIEPGDIANFTYHYLVSFSLSFSFSMFLERALSNHSTQQGFRSQAFYDLPPATEKEKKEEKKYIHVLDEL